MNPDFRKVALIAASLGLLVSLFIALRPEDDDTRPTTSSAATTTRPATTAAPATTEEPAPATTEAPPGPQLVEIDATSGEIVRATVERGQQVILNVRAGVADHVHLHGYDLMADVAPGQPAKISFRADIPGRFELELEDRELLIAELEVRA